MSEMWMRKSDVDLTEMVDEWVYAPIVNSRNKGFGGVAGILNPLLRYNVVARISIRAFQSLTIREKGVTITGIYASPQAMGDEERVVLAKIKKMSTGKALIIGDVNARHKSWIRKANTLGTRLKRGAARHHWNIKAPVGPTLTIRSQDVSTPDIKISKEMLQK